jgi:hypothetical protein
MMHCNINAARAGRGYSGTRMAPLVSRIKGMPRPSGASPEQRPGSRVTTISAFARRCQPARLGALFLVALTAACESSVSGPTPVDDPARVTIQPDTAVLYSGMPTTFTVSGGTGTYAITSSNQAVVQVPSFLNGRTFTVLPANVVADTSVTLSVRDSGIAPLATASLTVRPGTVANDIVVTPTSTQGGSCAPAVCSGGDAILFTTVSQGGNPLPARGVRLEVVTGDFRFITSAPGQPESLATTTTVVSDQAGGVLARLRVLPGAPNQTGVVQVTDLGTSAFRRATFAIAQSTGSSPGFFLVPDTLTFTGPNNLACATGVRADVSIFGGSPPYTIGNGGTAFSVSQNFVSQSGGSFYIVANTCAENIPIPVVDSAGRTATVTASNVLGTNAIPDLVVSPTSVTLSECSSQATVTVAGGIPNSFTVSNTSNAIITSSNPSSRIIGIQRSPNQVAATPILVGVASGDKVATITVNLTGDALNTRCDGSSLAVIPNSLDIAGCGFADAVISGGIPPYFPVTNNSSVTVQMVAPNTVRVTRVNGSVALPDGGTVTIFDNSNAIPRVSRTVSVEVTGNCP